MKKKLSRINQVLIERFGTPFKAAVPPDPLDLVIATILSQNTNDKNSFRAYQNLKKKFPQWEDILLSPHRELENAINVAGLTQQKASTIRTLIKYLNDKKENISLDYLKNYTDEEVLIELRKVKGIGVKTVSCVLLFSLERNVCPVDTHVHRVLNRVLLIKTATPEKTFEIIKNNIPEGRAHQFHTNLIRLGREICKPAVPVCYVCPLKKICKYPAKDFTKKVKHSENDFFLLDHV